MKTILNKYDLVLVRWLDANAFGKWQSLAAVKAAAPTHCEAVGWLIQKTKEAITLVSTASSTPEGKLKNLSNRMVIPTAMQKEIVVLRKKK